MITKELYSQAVENYFEVLDELDKLHGKQFKTQQRHKLKNKLKLLSAECKKWEAELSKENEMYLTHA